MFGIITKHPGALCYSRKNMPQARLTANDDKQILQINNFEVADR